MLAAGAGQVDDVRHQGWLGVDRVEVARAWSGSFRWRRSARAGPGRRPGGRCRPAASRWASPPPKGRRTSPGSRSRCRRAGSPSRPDEETVELRLGQPVDALLLDRVLRRQHQERRAAAAASSPRSSPGPPASPPAGADCVFAGARLTSSASSTCAKIGPLRSENSFVLRSKMYVPVTSDGSRSGVNCTRCRRPQHAGERLGERGLRHPRHPLQEDVPPASRAIRNWSTTSSAPTTTLPIACRIDCTMSARWRWASRRRGRGGRRRDRRSQATILC